MKLYDIHVCWFHPWLIKRSGVEAGICLENYINTMTLILDYDVSVSRTDRKIIHQTFNIRCPGFPDLYASCLVWQLSLPNLLKPYVKFKIKM